MGKEIDEHQQDNGYQNGSVAEREEKAKKPTHTTERNTNINQ